MDEIPSEKPSGRRVVRPWGDFRQFAHNQPVTVSLMTVRPGRRLSLQAHERRAELWIVLDPGGIVQVGEQILHPQPGDEIWISAGERHRLTSAKGAVRVLEVAFGDWQQEDITRFEDDYQRPAQGE